MTVRVDARRYRLLSSEARAEFDDWLETHALSAHDVTQDGVTIDEGDLEMHVLCVTANVLIRDAEGKPFVNKATRQLAAKRRVTQLKRDLPAKVVNELAAIA